MASNLSILLGAFIFFFARIPPGKAFKYPQRLEGCHKGTRVEGLHELKRYLEKFGYLNSGTPHDDEFDDPLEYAVRAYQLNYNLNVTGTLDIKTIQQMMVPRCGVPDIVNSANTIPSGQIKHTTLLNTVARYSFFPGKPKWPQSKTLLTYSFKSSVQVVDPQTLRLVCSRAFRRWQDASRFTFTEAPKGATSDIVIGFHRGDHGDGNPFDGVGGVFAHSFAPTIGQSHYDADEEWSTNPNSTQMDLETVILHEIGHLLGLGHSQDPNAVMYPFSERGSINKDRLAADDIEAIQALYAPKYSYYFQCSA